MPRRLPLFPLTVVLFPGALVPLHIFEPRYRRMLADCQAGDERFGVLPADPLHDAPPVGAVGCVAELRGVQPLSDGRANIVVAGARRFLLTRYLDEGTPYYLGAVTEFDDAAETAEHDAVTRLRTAYLGYAELRRALTDSVDEEELPLDATALSFHVAAGLEVERAERQRLLELRSTPARISLLLELLPAAAEATGRALRVRRRARGNGTGPHRPDVAASG
jgi:Lon protease-like protein